MTIEVRVPQLPESVADATLVSWHKKPGDSVARDENLVDLETDKVVLEVPAPVAGRTARADGGAPGADCRTPGAGASHAGAADVVQRGGPEGGERVAQPLQGAIRKTAWGKARIHVVLHQGVRRGIEEISLRQ